MQIIDGGQEFDLGLAGVGSLNKWFDYEIRQIEIVKPDGTKERCFRIWVDGDWETDLPTLKEAAQYVDRLRDSMR